MVPETNDSLAPDSASLADSTDYWTSELGPEAEPVVTGTLFVVIVILAIIAAIWAIMYLRLLDR